MGCFELQVIRGRWFMVFASHLIMAMSGVNYLYGLFSNDIKSSLGYDQATLNLVSFSKDLGCNVGGVLSGLVNEVTPPWVVLSIGATLNFFGYFMIWLAVAGHLKRVAVWQMCIYICMGANSLSFLNTGILVASVKNFPNSRGLVVGLSTGYAGLSGAILTQFYHALYGHDSKSLILLIAWLPTTITILLLGAIRCMKLVRQQNETRVFYNLFFISLSLAGFLMVMIIMQNNISFARAGYYASTLGVGLLLFTPLAVVIKEEYSLARQNMRCNVTNDDPNSINGVVIKTNVKQIQQNDQPLPNKKVKGQSSCITNIFKPPNRGEDYTILQAIFSIDMMLLFISTISGVGGTLTAIDNMGQIGRALGYKPESITTFVSSISIWNYLGRVLTGLVSEVILARYKFPRPMVMCVLLLVCSVGHLLIALAVPNSLYVASVIIGFCFGALCPLVHTITSEIFGLKHYSTLYNFVTLSFPIGTYILNATLTGKLYDKVALKQLIAKGLRRDQGKALACVGGECYKISFLLVAAATLFGSLAMLVLTLRTRKFYKGDIYKKFREAPEVAHGEMSSDTKGGNGVLRADDES